MVPVQNRPHFAVSLILIAVLLVQTLTHLAWLTISAHSGQVAIPWMMNQGRTLFGSLLEQHAPATSVIAALAQRVIGGNPVLVDRLLNLLLVLALTLLIYHLARHLAGTLAGVIAALIWFWWEPVYGNIMFYFDSLVGLLVLLALTAWIRLAPRRPRWLAPLIVGLLAGGATIAKQQAWTAVIVFALWLLITERQRLIAFIAGALILPLATVLVAALQGNFDAYLYWNWLFNLSGLMDGAPLPGHLLLKLVLSNPLVPVFLLRTFKPPLTRERQSFRLLIVALWLVALIDLLPRFTLVQAMAQLPLACAISGTVVAGLLPTLRALPGKWRQLQPAEALLAGVFVLALLSWLWLGIAPYDSAPLGRAGIPAADEFQPLAANLRAISQPGDTLFVLPETDSTPQIHLLSGLLPPGTWIKGWSWYLEAPGAASMLLDQWSEQPPTFIVYFPALIEAGQPGIAPLVSFMDQHCQPVETIANIAFHGDAAIERCG